MENNKFQVGDLLQVQSDVGLDSFWKDTLFLVIERSKNVMKTCVIYDATNNQCYAFRTYENQIDSTYNLVCKANKD